MCRPVRLTEDTWGGGAHLKSLRPLATQYPGAAPRPQAPPWGKRASPLAPGGPLPCGHLSSKGTCPHFSQSGPEKGHGTGIRSSVGRVLAVGLLCAQYSARSPEWMTRRPPPKEGVGKRLKFRRQAQGGEGHARFAHCWVPRPCAESGTQVLKATACTSQSARTRLMSALPNGPDCLMQSPTASLGLRAGCPCPLPACLPITQHVRPGREDLPQDNWAPSEQCEEEND